MTCPRPLIAVMVGCAAALIVRDDRRADGAGPHTLRSILGAGEGAGQLAPEAVREALARAGRAGLAASFELLNGREAAARAGAACYLGSRKSRLAVPGLIKLLRDPDAVVRRAAARALGAIGDPQALRFLERAVGECDSLVAEAALGAVRDIRRAEQAPRRPPFPIR